MTIDSLGNIRSIDPYSSTAAAPSTSTVAGADSDGDQDGSVGASAGQLSPRAQFLSKLQALEKSDPAKAKQVLTDLADKLRADAQSASGPRADHLNALADKLQKAADTGDLAGLQPSGHAGGHHGHHKAQNAYRQSASSGESLLDMLNAELSATSSTVPPVASSASAPAATSTSTP